MKLLKASVYSILCHCRNVGDILNMIILTQLCCHNIIWETVCCYTSHIRLAIWFSGKFSGKALVSICEITLHWAWSML